MLSRSTVNPLLINLVGWLSGATLPVLFLAIYQHRERHLRARSDFVTTAFGKPRMVAAAMLGLVVSIYHGYGIAGWLAS